MLVLQALLKAEISSSKQQSTYKPTCSINWDLWKLSLQSVFVYPPLREEVA